jgi:hypothetical protein
VQDLQAKLWLAGLSEKFEKLVRTASLLRHLRTVSTKQEQMRGLAGK